VRLGLLFAVRFLGALNSGTRFRDPGLGVKCYPVGLVNPDRNAVSIPIFENIVRFEQEIIPFIPLLVRWIVEYYGNWWLTGLYCCF
jgi:hypothetical protein